VESESLSTSLGRAMNPGVRVLDVAAGTGRWLALYAEKHAHPILIDISSDMLKIANEKARGLGLSSQIIEADILKLNSLPEADWLISTRFFNWIPLSGVRKVLSLAAKAGIQHFAITVRMTDNDASWAKRFHSLKYWQGKNLRVLLGRRKYKGIYYLQSGSKLRKMFAQLNLAVIEEIVLERVRGEVYKLIIARAA
jgi:SAM-dependent methyltransferase